MSDRTINTPGRLGIGGWCSIPGTTTVETMARSAVDWICIDLQHGMIDVATMFHMVQASSIIGKPTLIRMGSHDEHAMMQVLDAGATGVIAPAVDTPEQAAAVAAAVRYPPVGIRSWGPTRAAMLTDGYTAEAADAAVICGIQIESATAVENLTEILATPGIDVVVVGPSDLALSLGERPGVGIRGPKHEAALRTIFEGCVEAGVVPGIYAGGRIAAGEFGALGYRDMAVAHDANALAQGIADSLRDEATDTAEGRTAY